MIRVVSYDLKSKSLVSNVQASATGSRAMLQLSSSSLKNSQARAKAFASIPYILQQRNSSSQQQHCRKPQKRLHQITCRVQSSVKEQGTGVEFLEVTDFWQGETFRCLGAGNRQKKFGFIGVKVYAIALYVEAVKAAKELGIRDRGGFFKDAPDDDYLTALVDGAFDKILQVQLVRKIEGNQFYEALEQTLAPKLQLTGGRDALQKFGNFINSQQLDKGVNVIMLWRGSDNLDIVVKPNADFSKVQPDLTLQSIPLCRGLFEVFLGSDSVVPDAKRQWAQGARNLLETDRVQKDTRAGGF